VALPSYQAFAATDLLDQLAVKRMLAKLSSRRYRVGLEPVGSSVEQASSGTSRSAVSRRFVARTEHALAELLAQDLSGLGPGRAHGGRHPGGRALLSCVGFGWYEGRAMGLRKGEWVQSQVGEEVLMEVVERC
jgi:hypothetical protein